MWYWQLLQATVFPAPLQFSPFSRNPPPQENNNKQPSSYNRGALAILLVQVFSFRKVPQLPLVRVYRYPTTVQCFLASGWYWCCNFLDFNKGWTALLHVGSRHWRHWLLDCVVHGNTGRQITQSGFPRGSVGFQSSSPTTIGICVHN